MRTLILAVAGLALASVVLARPQVIEPVQVFPHPYGFRQVAISGDWALASTISRDPSGISDLHEAQLFKRDASGFWSPQGTLTSSLGTNFPIDDVALDGAIAAVAFPSGLQIFQRTASGWEQQSTDAPLPEGFRVAISGSTILAHEDRCSYSAMVVTTTDPHRWSGSVDGRLRGEAANCTGFPPEFELDVSGNRAIVWNGDAINGPPPYEARIFERNGSLWPQTATLSVPANETFPYRFGPRVAIRGSMALVSGSTGGTHVYRRDSRGAWKHTGIIPEYDAYPWTMNSFSLDISGDKVLSVSPAVHRGVDVAHVHQERGDGSFEEVAMLAAPEQLDISDLAADGNHVVAVAGRNLYFFDLPATFPPSAPVVQEDFQSGTPAGWSTLDTSRFTLEPDGITRVWRQNSVAGSSGAIHEVDWQDQSIAADVRPIAFKGPDRWVGLMTRYQDESNYYYITLRDRDHLAIKRMVNGEFSTLAERSLPVTPGVTYRLQFEASGSLLNAYIDGVNVLTAQDTALTHGHPGIRMHMARADYDNIVIAPGARRALYQAAFEFEDVTQLTRRGGDWFIYNDSGNMRLRQSQTAGTARATVGASTNDQVLQVAVRLTGWSGGVPWAGLMARYTDTGNYYYVKLGSNGVVSLRKLVDGKVNVLASAGPVDPQQWMTLRLEVVGCSLRVFRNNQLIIETRDGTHKGGTSGFITHDATADFDDYIAYQP